ncbi:hypothetical protein D3C73_1302840 [compost metagenome]
MQRHTHRARNWGGRQRENIHIFTDRLDLVFMVNPKTMFLINDHQPNIFESNIRLDQAMGANNDIDLAALKSL